jgi:YgiT-type zinc finger domain-containing protein
MKCVICKVGETRPGRTVVTLERESTTLVFKAVPAEVCANCGEAYVAEEVSRQILATAEHAAGSGFQVDVREFVGAAT